jgi:hypothetical protein
MIKEIEKVDTVYEYTCDICKEYSTDPSDMYLNKCLGCKRDICTKYSCSKSLYPLEYTFSVNSLCPDCYIKIYMFIEEAKKLKLDLDDKLLALKNNIRKVLHVK